jgi:hypothetical protein
MLTGKSFAVIFAVPRQIELPPQLHLQNPQKCSARFRQPASWGVTPIVDKYGFTGHFL